jgi:murein DD-endopeptidase MepM/ murein hydrolase activator NlpD
MNFLFRWLLRAVLLAVLAVGLLGGALYYLAGTRPGPTVDVTAPARFIGVAGTLDVTVTAPGGTADRIEIALEQGETRAPLFSLANPPSDAELHQTSEHQIRITKPIGRQSLPELKPGPARLVVTAARRVLYGIRDVETTVARDLQVRFDPPRLAVLSTHHFVNHGGAEMVVYRVTPPEAQSGVRVGSARYPGYPASGAGVAGADPSTKVAFFALTYDQDLATPIELYGVDEAGNQARADIDHRIFPRAFRRSTIEVDEDFFRMVVPGILERSPDLARTLESESGELLPAFLKINGELRRQNNEKIAALLSETAPEILWSGPFVQMSRSKVESSFADHRTYRYNGTEVDQQVHLGFDLASTAAAPVHAGNRGRVVHADYLGIYGNTVILDHGMGVQSLYAHLSSLEVTTGQMVEKDQVVGRSGRTGLAAGDHLHFTLLVGGQPANPVEWWDPHWIEDRITRKLTAAGGR